MKCDCCGKYSECGAVSMLDRKCTCDNCLKYAPSYYGLYTVEELHNYIKKRKSKRWWQIWKN